MVRIRMIGRWVAVVIAGLVTVTGFADTGIMSSQLGYDLGDPMHVMVRSDRPDLLSSNACFALTDSNNRLVLEGAVRKWGEKWGSHWWIVDFSDLQSEGSYKINVKDGSREVLTSDSIEVLQASQVESLFQTLLLDALLEKKRILPALVVSMATWRHSGFSVHSKPAPADPKDPAFFHMLRYMKKPAVALYKIAFDAVEGKVVYTADFNPLLGTDRIETDPLDFLARVLIHVPEKNARRVIDYGLYSSRVRGERKKRQQNANESGKIEGSMAQTPDEPLTDADAFTKKRKAAWAKLIQMVWVVSPLACPRCGGAMKVVSVITDHAVIDKILKHLQKRKRGPPEEEAARVFQAN